MRDARFPYLLSRFQVSSVSPCQTLILAYRQSVGKCKKSPRSLRKNMSPRNLVKAQRRRVTGGFPRFSLRLSDFAGDIKSAGGFPRFSLRLSAFAGDIKSAGGFPRFFPRRALQSVSQGPETGQKIMAENGVFRRPNFSPIPETPAPILQQS